MQHYIVKFSWESEPLEVHAAYWARQAIESNWSKAGGFIIERLSWNDRIITIVLPRKNNRCPTCGQVKRRPRKKVNQR